MALVSSGSVAPSYPRAQNTSRARSSASSTSNCRVRPEGTATSFTKQKMVAVLDPPSPAAYTFSVPIGTVNFKGGDNHGTHLTGKTPGRQGRARHRRFA